MAEITVNQELCTHCGACVELCSVTHVYDVAEEGVPVPHPQRCWECGQCVAACPVDAITHSSFPLEECPPIEKQSDGCNALMKLMRERRSVRVYQKRQIERDTVEKLIETTSWAPSGSNLQQVAWQVLDDREAIDGLEQDTIHALVKEAEALRLYAAEEGTRDFRGKIALRLAKSYEHLERRLMRGEKPVFFGAPLLLFAVTPDTPFGRDDAVIAGYGMQLAAAQMGLATCQIGYFIAAHQADLTLGAEVLRVAPEHVMQMALTVGYPKYKLRRYVARQPQSFEWLG